MGARFLRFRARLGRWLLHTGLNVYPRGEEHDVIKASLEQAGQVIMLIRHRAGIETPGVNIMKVDIEITSRMVGDDMIWYAESKEPEILVTAKNPVELRLLFDEAMQNLHPKKDKENVVRIGDWPSR